MSKIASLNTLLDTALLQRAGSGGPLLSSSRKFTTLCRSRGVLVKALNSSGQPQALTSDLYS